MSSRLGVDVVADTVGLLAADHVLEFAYTRSTGPVLGAFLAGLRAGRVFGVRAEDGRVVVPPQEYDPVTGASLAELVEVGTTGTVVTWTWNPTPRPGHPLAHPFAWVLVRLDGADTPLLHALDVAGPEDVRTGMRVRVRWAAQREGRIQDIAAFEPDPLAPGDDVGRPRPVDEDVGRVDVITTPVRVEMTHQPGIALDPFLRGTQRRELLGRRCRECGNVYLPPRGVCSMCGAGFTDEQVPCGPHGTVTTFLVVNVPFASQEVPLPYTAAEVLLDGADTTSQFLLLGTDVDDVRIGMRVRVVWDDADELEPTLSNVTHVEAIDEPDVPYEQIAHLA